MAGAVRSRWLLGTLLAAGCSGDPRVITIEVTPGHEGDAFSREPALVRIDVTASSPEGDLSLAASSAPGGSFDLGEVPEDRMLHVEVGGFDATQALRLRGRSLDVLMGGLLGDVLPVFAQRLDGWARPPGELRHSHVGGVAAVLGERYLLLTGGKGLGTEGEVDERAAAYYDLLALGGAQGGTLPRAAASLPVTGGGSVALLIDAEGATWLDFQSGAETGQEPPSGLAGFGELAGGQVVPGPDGASFVVGATRPDAPSDAVLAIDAQGGLSVARLAHARQGAAAAWVPDHGLAVAGGSSEAPGLEILPEGASITVEPPFPPDATRGAAAVALPAGKLALLGGSLDGAAPPARLLDPGCTADCAPQIVGDPPADVALRDCRGFAAAGMKALIVCAELPPDGLCRTFAVDLAAAAVAELVLREPRRGATALAAPNGMLAIVGGEHPDGSPALTVEMLVPGQ
ncbi:MAG: hypothetical protein HY744_14005 [Deltaproteobacteria bacterium]|nr:hypothetical protein [Deltaproteobacteria bacterium]